MTDYTFVGWVVRMPSGRFRSGGRGGATHAVTVYTTEAGAKQVAARYKGAVVLPAAVTVAPHGGQ